jgi:hypothetical protein
LRAGGTLLLVGCSLPALSTAALAQAAATDEIVVTGQAVPGAVIGDIPAENQLNRADIDAYGVDSVSELLDEIAAQTSSNQGRSDDGPVVLVNGKRISGVNEVNDLPTEAVLRLDILPEEVALKYGYDAQRKVVNIILRRRFRSQLAKAGGGLATQGQGENLTAAIGYTRIHDNDRINLTARAKTSASLLESERDVIVDPDAARDPTGRVSDDRAYRTLSPSTRTYTLNATVARQLSERANLSWNGRLDYESSAARNGLPSDSLTAADGTTVNRILSLDPLRQDSRTLSLNSGVSLNVDLSKLWRLSLVGNYSHSDTRTDSDRGYDLDAVQAAIDCGDGDASGTLPAYVLGRIRTQRARALQDTGSASLLLNGKLFKLPAGNVGMSMRLSGDTSSLRSSTSLDGLLSERTTSRTNGGAQISFDLPIASPRNHVLSALGTLTANVNASVMQVSDYGTLGTLGYGLSWTPRTGITIIAAINNDRTAPTLEQRNSPSITTSNVRIYDYVRGQSATVTQVSGGNPTLRADDRRQFKLGATVKPFAKINLTLSANYADSVTRDAIISLSGVSSALEAAFPDRYTRDADGALMRIDTRSVNVAREEVKQLRWGFNFTQILRKPKRPEPPAGMVPPWRRMAQADTPVQDGVPSGDKSEPGAAAPDASERPGGTAEGGPDAGEDGADILVNGHKQDDAVPMGAPGGFDGPDGFGPPPGGPLPDGGPPPGGAPPGGGPGGPGGFGPPPGGGPFGGGSDNGARLQLSLYHSLMLRDAVLLTQGGPWVDLLNGGTLGGSPQPRHKVQLSSGLIDNGVGVRLDGNWQSASHVTGDQATSGGDLRFGQLVTFNLRLFANLSNRLPGKDWARGMRVSLDVGNLLNQRQKVTDATGATPIAYQPAYLDPEGRTLMLSVRKIF